MPSPFPCSPVIRECLWKKTQIEKKVDQLVRREKKWDAVYISNQGSDIDWMKQYQIVKTRCDYEGYFLKFSEFWANSTKCKPQVAKGSVACGQGKDYQKMAIKC